MAKLAALVFLARLSAGAVIYVDAAAAGANDGTSWADAFTDLQSALAAAASGDEIWAAEGAYKPTSGADRTISFALVAGAAFYGGFVGTESARAERDWLAHETILSGDIGTVDDNTDNSYHVVLGASNAALDGFTVTGGNASGATPDDQGAGMYNDGVTSLAVANCVFCDNLAHDTAMGTGAGGGMYNFGASITVTNCTFSGNYAERGGGGLRNEQMSFPTFAGCTFAGNSAGNAGGGMHNWYSSSIVTNCVFAGNTARVGGGMHNNNSLPAVTNCTFSNNTADDWGGGIHNFDSSSADVENCILWGDSAPAGPEIYNETVSSCTVSYSDVGQVGGFTDGGGNVNADPKFVDADGADDVPGTADDDLRLQAGSPCIDAADGDAAPAQDMDGNPRNDDTGTVDTGTGAITYADMGACEFQGGNPASVSILSPDGGEAWFAGTQEAITWSMTGDPVPNVRIELSRDDGATWDHIDGGTPVANTGSFDWVPTGSASVVCLVRVSDALDGNPVDASDAAFAIREAMTLALSQEAALEGDGVLGIGTVSVPTAVSGDLEVDLLSSDETEVVAPTMVTILDGQTAVTFDAIIVDDVLIDGRRTVTVTASATAYTSGQDSITVNDNDPLQITIASPAEEGDGAVSGTVGLDEAPEGDLTVSFSSSDLSEAGDPAAVTITTADTSQTFSVPIQNDGIIDGPRTVTITASAAGCADGSGQLVVNDDDPLRMPITSPAIETDATVSGTVELDEGVEANLLVSFVSSDLSEAGHPADVTVTSGGASQTFSVPIQNDGMTDGPRTVTITASAAGCASGTGQLVVNDDDPLHVSLPSEATEGEPPLAATLEIDEAPGEDTEFPLVSDDTTELTVPGTVTIQAGQLSAVFLVTPVDDGEIDGDQPATVTASLTGWADGSGSMDVLDGANQAITVTLPASATEGDGTLAGAGSVSIPGTFATDLSISLSSDDTSELAVPADVTITSGQTSVTFDLIVADDALVDGPRPVTVTVSLAGWADGVASMTVLDDDVGTLVVTLPASATEGDGTLADAGTVSIPGTWATNLVLDLQSSDTTELTVSATVTIPQGETSASFDLTVVEDGVIDWTRTASVTATLAGWTPSSAEMDIFDNYEGRSRGGCGSGRTDSAALAFCVLVACFALKRRRRVA